MINNGRIAVIERKRAGTTYFVVPSGGAEPGETIQETAHREALEETSLEVRIHGPVAHIAFADSDHGAMQHYFAAEVISGTIGPGSGPEFDDRNIERGFCRPKWLPLEEAHGLDIRPAALAAVLNQDLDGLLSRPLLLEESV